VQERKGRIGRRARTEDAVVAYESFKAGACVPVDPVDQEATVRCAHRDEAVRDEPLIFGENEIKTCGDGEAGVGVEGNEKER